MRAVLRWPNGRFSSAPPPPVREGEGWKRSCGRDGWIHDRRTEAGEVVEIVVHWPPWKRHPLGYPLAEIASREAEESGVPASEVLAVWKREAEAERLGTN